MTMSKPKPKAVPIVGPIQKEFNSSGEIHGPSISELKKGIKHDAAKALLPTAHNEVLAGLLSQIQPVNYREKADLDEEDKVKMKHYLVITVEEILALAERNQWGLCRRDGFVYVYNGVFWKATNQDELKAFLKLAAEKMGVDRFDARHTAFATQLFEQFMEAAYQPAPAPSENEVLINLLNGTFAVSKDGQYLRPPDRKDFLTYQLPFTYDRDATAPQWQRFLDRVLPDKDSQKVLAEYIGYLFTKKLKLEKTLLLYGTGANGKSVFFEIIMALLGGNNNVSNYTLQSLTIAPAYARAELSKYLLNYASEISGKLEANIFKQLVSGEPLEARLPYGQPFILENYAKLIFNCNELPTDVEHTFAFFRRFLIVPFTVTIPEKEQDKQLAEKIIKSELSGIFNWVLEGLQRLLKQGNFTDCKAAQNQLDMYKRQADSVLKFIDENGYKPDTGHFEKIQDLYHEYKRFCAEDGYRAVSKLKFKERLESNRYEVTKRNIGLVVFLIQAAE